MPTLYRVAFERTRLDGRIDRGSFTSVLIVPRRGLAVGGRNEHDDKADRAYLADPSVGSKHNRGCAVDLTLYDLKTGKAVRMPSLYDEASPRASPDYTGGTAKQRALRDLLRRAMEAQGFIVEPMEWWHFDYRDWESYALQNIPFEALGQ